jgi:ABC-type multidrug transport system fused ATPase/permease subunit
LTPFSQQAADFSGVAGSVRIFSDSFRKEIMPGAIKTRRTLLLQSLFGKYRGRLLVTYIVTLVENLFELFYPSLTGLAVNGLLNHDFTGLGLLLGVWFVHTATGVFRQSYDTRVFSSIYTDLATRTVSEQETMGVSTSQIVARSSLSREFVNFFERDVPATVNSLFGLLGALVLLFFYDVWSAVFCLMLLVPLAILNRRYSRRTLTLNKRLNNQLEREVTVLTRRTPSRVLGHYRLLAKWHIYLSDAEATNWGLMELFSIVLSAAVITRIASLKHLEPGTIYAMLAYLWNFIASLNHVPALVQQLSRLKDIAQRMDQSLSTKAEPT